MSGVASLGMYDHVAQRTANDRLWAAIAAVLRAQGVAGVPESLDRSRSVEDIWRDPDLLFGQICGYPLIRQPGLGLRVLALPRYDVPGSEADTHRSFLIARQSDAVADLTGYRGRHAAINSWDSNSGMNLFRAAIAPIAGGRSFFSDISVTGSHRQSVSAVLRGKADIAAIDNVTYAALARHEPEVTRGLRIVGHTSISPTLPFVTGRSTSANVVERLQNAIEQVFADPALADARASLFLAGTSVGELARFELVRQAETDAVGAGYPVLH